MKASGIMYHEYGMSYAAEDKPDNRKRRGIYPGRPVVAYRAAEKALKLMGLR